MRIPVKSERDAFLLAYGIAAVVGAAVVLGVVAGALYGVVLLAGAVIGALVWSCARTTRTGRSRFTMRRRPRPGATPRAIACS